MCKSIFSIMLLICLAACGPTRDLSRTPTASTPARPTHTPTEPVPPTTSAEPTQEPSHEGQFLVVSQRLGQPTRLYRMEARQGTPVALTDGKSNNWSLVWSPDGNSIVFISDRDGQAELYRMNPDGSAQTRLTRSEMDKQLLSGSPDGKKLAFVDKLVPEGPPPVRSNLYVVDVDGTGLLKIVSEMVYPYSVVWSPDSQRLAFIQPVVTEAEPVDELMIVNADGSGLKSLSGESGQAELFSFSPDGQRLVYGYLSPDQQTHQLRVVDVGGGPATVIYDAGAGPAREPVHPLWTRANQILFVDAATQDPTRYDVASLYRIDPDGRNLVHLAANERMLIGASVDGKTAALVVVLGEGETRTTEIQILNMDGTVARQVTHLGLYFDSVAGSPDGTYFSFLAYPDAMMQPPAVNWVVSLDGSVQRQITGLGDYIEVVWRP